MVFAISHSITVAGAASELRFTSRTDFPFQFSSGGGEAPETYNCVDYNHNPGAFQVIGFPARINILTVNRAFDKLRDN